jgi:hypothetical protein
MSDDWSSKTSKEIKTMRAEFIANFSCPGCGGRVFKSEEQLQIDRKIIQNLDTMTGERIASPERIVPGKANGYASAWICDNCRRTVEHEDAGWLDGCYFKIAWTDRQDPNPSRF